MIVFACTLGGALLGMWLRTILPDHHVNAESRDTTKLAMGLVATMTALLLGLVTASAKSSFDTVNTAVKQTAMDLLTLDRLLARYGPETRETRRALQDFIANRVDTIWPESSSRPAQLDPIGSGAASGVERLVDGLRGLTPRDDAQRALHSRALNLAEVLLQGRWIVLAVGGTSIPLPFLVVLLFWLTITFGTFGLLAPRHTTMVVVLFACALSVGSAVFLILELDGPFDGLLKVSADPLRYVLAHINQ